MSESQPRRGTKALEIWCRRITEGYPNVKIENMSTSWRDGLAFCAMIHHFRPDLIDFEKLNKEDIFHNNDLAFRTAEQYLGIPALLEAGDMKSYDVPDRLSILTYLSQFYRAFSNSDSSPDRGRSKLKSPVKDINNLTPLSTLKNSSSSPENSPPLLSNRNYLNSDSVISPIKREPCLKCGLPVFLAERVFYKNNLYHNSCFTCSRCNGQLVPGNLTKIIDDSVDETKPNQFTCQSCQDKQMGMLLFDDDFDGQETDTDQFLTYNETNNAFGKQLENYENLKDDLLTKPLSDEEKRKSVKGYYDKDKNGEFGRTSFNEKSNDIRLNDGDGENVDNLLNKSKLDDVKHQNLSLKFATQLLLNVNDNNDVSLDDNNIVEETFITNTDKIILKKSNDHCISSEADGNNIVVDEINTENSYDIINNKMNENEGDDSSVKQHENISGENENDGVELINNLHLESNHIDNHQKLSNENEPICDELMSINNNIPLKDEVANIPDVVNNEITVQFNVLSTNETKENDVDDSSAGGDNLLQHEIEIKVTEMDGDGDIHKDIENEEEILVKIDVRKKILPNDVFIDKPIETHTDRLMYPKQLNPFGDDDEEEEDEIRNSSKPIPKPRVSTNPFGDDDDESEETESITDRIVPVIRKTPVPAPRRSLSAQSQSPFGSNQSINSISRHKKGKAPLPPTTTRTSLNISSTNNESPTPSLPSTPKMKKKRPAPTPPSVTPIKNTETEPNLNPFEEDEPKISKYMSQNLHEDTTSMTDQYKVSLARNEQTSEVDNAEESSSESLNQLLNTQRRVIPLDLSLMTTEGDKTITTNYSEVENATIEYKRKLRISTNEISDEDNSLTSPIKEISERQLEKMKDNKEAKNRNRKSAELSNINDITQIKWRHTKGPAPPLPICRFSIKHELSNQEINHELEVIKVQQNGLEKQGVMLEKMIRNRSEESIDIETVETSSSCSESEVEDLIMQLFEIVNEKNELFRRQAELLNLRRQYRLEQEQSDLEYKIRLSMAQPERNKTDSDKEREDALIQRLIQVVQQRNEVVECFEMDRLREIEEDLSIKKSLEMHTAKRETKLNQQTLTKLSKKEKKKLKEAFKLTSHSSKKNKVDADKDEDETEVTTVPTKQKKHKFIKFSLIK